MSAQRLASLDVRRRRFAVVRTFAVVLGSWAALIAAFYVYPGHAGTSAGAVVKVVAGVAVVTAVTGYEVWRVTRAPIPELRAIEALGVILPLFLTVFAAIYLSLGQGAGTEFNVVLDHSKALYFVVTVFSTVGFGDIVPRTDEVRLIVATQMVLDLVLIGAVARLIVTAARRSLDRTGEP